MARLRERGAPSIQLMVREDNLIAAGFYAALRYDVQPVNTLAKRLDALV
jgi:ribosomal protein S18 acetylase RimI-like enzyme